MPEVNVWNYDLADEVLLHTGLVENERSRGMLGFRISKCWTKPLRILHNSAIER